ncbi:MAG: acyl--CoA ligase [Acidimicrobiaceae bacterium]|nr:acyl--CoA ligase [Acidimicrobiaceae bacterium]
MFGTTVDVMRKWADRWPERTFIISDKETLTYGDYQNQVNQLANWLLHQGVGPGDNVGFLMLNCVELYVGLLAVHRLGAIANLWNFRLNKDEVTYLASHVHAKAVIVSPGFLPTVSGIDSSVILTSGSASTHTVGLRSFGEVSLMPTTEPEIAGPSENDLSSVIYTSGTTGHPKGATYTHQTQLLSAIQYCLEMGLGLGSRGISAAPVIHGGATNFFMAYFFIGATFIDSGKYQAEHLLDLTLEHHATELMAVPTQILELLKAAEKRNLPQGSFESLNLIRTAGSPYAKEMVDRIHQTLGCHLLNTFGMTENCSNVTTMHSGYDPESAWTTIGKPTYFWDAKVIELNDEASETISEVSRPGRGQLVVKGPQNVQRYYMSDLAPRFTDGWLFARDVVDIGSAGYLQIIDRVDSTILSGGENVYPQEVEMFLKTHPSIEDAAVTGIADPTWGERVVALVISNDPELTEQDIESWSLENSAKLARYKRPRQIVFVSSLPKNVFGKLERYKLKDEFFTAR